MMKTNTTTNSENGQSEYHQNNYVAQRDFECCNSVIGDGIQKDKDMGISTLAFDSQEELLWMGTVSGHVTSYYGAPLQKYTSFQVHGSDQVRNILTLENNIVVLTNTTLRFQHRRGLPQLTHTSKNLQDMHSLLYNHSTSRLLMSGMQDKLIDFDIGSMKEIASYDTLGSCAILREHSRYICSADAPKGIVHLRDPKSCALLHTLEAHTGSLSDFDVHGHLLVTCGESLRHGILQPDRFLMVYDLRILRAINPISSLVTPYQLRFLPSLTSQIVIMSAGGQIQMADTACLSTPQDSLFQLNMPMEDCTILSLDISPSTQCIAFGDTAHNLYLYSNTTNPVLNPYARSTEFADPVESLPFMDINDDSAIYSLIPRPHLPPGTTSHCSDFWPPQFEKPAYRPTPTVDPEYFKNMKMVGNIGYVQNVDKIVRNLVPYVTHKRREGTKQEAEIEKKPKSENSDFGIPKRYQKIIIKYSKMGADDFDFDRYNRTGFCGLESSLPNAYSNSMLQMLYFTEKLRLILLNHTCNRETCLACELSFLFHMMDISRGIPCQSSNFLRSLRTIPEASALGIILSDDNLKTNVPRLIQSWNRFILQQIHGQCATNSVEMTRISDLFGIKQNKIISCSKCLTSVNLQDTLLVVNMVYPELTDLKYISFSDVVSSSLCPEQTTPAWCDICRKYQPSKIKRVVTSLPNTLNLNAGMDNQTDITWWQIQMELLLRSQKSMTTEEESHIVENNTGKPCRYGLNCNRQTECKFWHPQASSPQELDTLADELYKLNLSWVPLTITLHRHSNGTISHDILEDVVESKTYKLYGVCSSIHDSETGDTDHLVASINVGPSYHSRSASPVSQWYIFNDISITTILAKEATWFNLNWKIPCVFTFSCIDDYSPISSSDKNKDNTDNDKKYHDKGDDDIKERSPFGVEVFREDMNFVSRGGRKRNTFFPLTLTTIPKKGDLVAIDAEFVTLNQEESELRSDGKVSLLKAAHMSVARITVVRGSGILEGAPFIDDYISTQEQVVDYVTKFSGIKPGDLDANYSSKHLTTLKSTYQKLRFLVDAGCIFIGHGLKNDFRVINIVVPPEQVIDTVILFHLPHHRMVSLKFLAWFFLRIRIQEGTHDSIEDAVTALSLYKKYLRLKADKEFIEALNSLYDKGKELGWKVPSESNSN